MSKILLTFIVLSILASCKVNQAYNSSKITSSIDGLNVPTTREFTSTELLIARRVCTNIKNKRDFFATLYNMTEKFMFNVELKTCEGTTAYYNANFEALIANTNATYPEYSATQDTYFKDVVTDQSGNIKPLCDVVFGIDHVNNTITIGSAILSYNILINNEYDRVEISKKVKDVKGNWNLAGIESIDFISKKPQAAAKFFGVEKERTLRKNCDGKNFSSIKQTWIQATTSF